MSDSRMCKHPMCERFMCDRPMCGHPMTERLVCDRPMRDHPMCERPDTKTEELKPSPQEIWRLCHLTITASVSLNVDAWLPHAVPCIRPSAIESGAADWLASHCSAVYM